MVDMFRHVFEVGRSVWDHGAVKNGKDPYWSFDNVHGLWWVADSRRLSCESLRFLKLGS